MKSEISIKTNNTSINNSIDIAINDINGNIKELDILLNKTTGSVLIAGADYDRPWTRDTAINVYNGFCYINKKVAYNTLISVLEKQNDKIYIGGQYWDSIIWALGAYQYYLVTHNKEFLNIAYEAISNTLEQCEQNEYTLDFGLFRGAAVYGDGVSAYPYIYGYAETSSSILHYPKYNKEKCYDKGVGIPMHTLSTNAVYVLAYEIIIKISDILNKTQFINQ